MSYRDTFVTEFIICDRCFDGLLAALRATDPSNVITPVLEKRVIAGYLRGSYGGETTLELDMEHRDRINVSLCHPVRLVLLREEGKPQTLTFGPGLIFPDTYGRK